MSARPRGLFIGVTSVDIVHRVDRLPGPDEKLPGRELLITTGGPVTTAAVTFAWLGGDAHVLSALGRHTLAAVARDDLAAHGVRHTDLAPEYDGPPHTSSVLVQADSGARALVYGGLPAAGATAVPIASLVAEVKVVLADGHQLPLSVTAARAAHANHVPVVLDAGSWRAGLAELLPYVDYAVCAEAFRPPGCGSVEAVLEYLATAGVPHRAVTRGQRPVLFASPEGTGEVVVPVLARVVDTLGAGDVFHGAFCYHLVAHNCTFTECLARAAALATRACASFGPRAWMNASAPTA